MREICENLESDIFWQLNIWLEYEVGFVQTKNVLSVEIIVYLQLLSRVYFGVVVYRKASELS